MEEEKKLLKGINPKKRKLKGRQKRDISRKPNKSIKDPIIFK